MSDEVDEHLERAFASLDEVSVRELEATAKLLERRRDLLGDFSSVFREVAWARENDSDPHLVRFHVRQSVQRADEDFMKQLAEAEAPFWRHVRDALAERHP